MPEDRATVETLQVYGIYLKGKRQKMFKDARASYFADLTSSNKDNPLELFNVISDIVSTAPFELSVFSNENYSSFLLFFVPFLHPFRSLSFETLFVCLCAEPQ